MEDTNQKFYTTEEVAEMLKVNRESVRRWVRKGKLKSIKLGGKFIRISQNQLDTFIKESESVAKDQTKSKKPV